MKHVIHNFGPDSGIERDYRRWCYMADNVEANAGSGGAVFKTDDDGTAHWPYVKLAWGADNTYTILAAGASALPISDGGNTLTVDGSAVTQPISGTVTANAGTGTMTVDGSGVTQPVSGTVTANLSATDNTVLDNIQTSVDTVAAAVSTEMQVDVVAALPAGANAIGDVGISGARTSGGTTFFHSDDLDETEEEIKGSAGQIYFITAFNVSAALLYLQVFNATAASVTVGTTPPDMVFPVPTQGDTNGAGFVLSVPNGIAMGTAITMAATTTPTGGTGAGANEVLVNVGYA